MTELSEQLKDWNKRHHRDLLYVSSQTNVKLLRLVEIEKGDMPSDMEKKVLEFLMCFD